MRRSGRSTTAPCVACSCHSLLLAWAALSFSCGCERITSATFAGRVAQSTPEPAQGSVEARTYDCHFKGLALSLLVAPARLEICCAWASNFLPRQPSAWRGRGKEFLRSQDAPHETE